MPVVIAVSAVAFLALHMVLWRATGAEYGRAFKMARGIAAGVLTLLGLAGLIGALPHWRVGFLYEHPPGDWMVVGVSVAYGHLLADFASMAWGRLARGEAQRLDLAAHHGLGLLAYGVSLWLGIGHALVLVSLASEVMPCCTGLAAWGRHLGRARWTELAPRLRLRVLVAWRLPLWAAVVVLLVRALLLGTLPAGYDAIAVFVLACLALLIALDVYWVRASLEAARRHAARPEALRALTRRAAR